MAANRSRSLSRLSLLAATALTLTGCALFQSARLDSTPDTAVVRSAPWGKVYRGGYVQILSVSGYEPSLRNRRDVAVPPGEQRGAFAVNLCPDGAYKRCYPVTTTEIAFRAEPGRSYLVKAREKVNGSNEFWVWVEDEQSHAVVGGVAPGA
jgi:hypothetical protein